MAIESKVKEYKIAIEKYHSIPRYTQIEFCASVIIITLQISSVINLILHYQKTNIIEMIIIFFMAYVTTDFINGLVHMIMDNSTDYTSFIAPFVAAFKLHHSQLTYKNAHLLKIYFYESGHKLWLVFYLLFLFIMQWSMHVDFKLNLFLVIIGVISSVAELSHYWCHNISQGNFIIYQLQKYRVLLSMDHHKLHHCNDNINYAFLNGLSDPLLNIIAKRFYQGYKNRSDKHVVEYQRAKNL